MKKYKNGALTYLFKDQLGNLLCYIDIMDNPYDDKYNIVFNELSDINYKKLFNAKFKKKSYTLSEAVLTVEEFAEHLEKLEAFI